jgi:hypothetical protein
MLNLIEKGSGISHDELERTLTSLNDQIDRLFVILKESERIILAERESLALIGMLAERLKMSLSQEDNSKLIEEISSLSDKRL